MSYRTTIISEHGICSNTFDWDATNAIRISWDVSGETVLELAMTPDETALRVSIADVRAMVQQREQDLADRSLRQAVKA